MKVIPGYEDYKINNKGEIYSNKRNIILKHSIDGRGYSFVKLYKNRKYKNWKIHKLVMLSYVGESNGLQVNHKDGNKQNNNLENLEYCTASYNVKHSYIIGLNKANMSALGKVGALNPLSKKVNQFDLENNLIKKWESIYDINKELGFLRDKIVRVCNGKRKTAYKFIWKYETN